MVEMVENRKGSAVLEDRRDLMSNMISASMENGAPQKDFHFTQRDLLGNIFIFLVAGKRVSFPLLHIFPLNNIRGHETTASVLASAMALLATHQEEQEELLNIFDLWFLMDVFPYVEAVFITLCSLSPIRDIKTFRNLRGFSPSSTKHYGFSLQ
jgi:cytochrome P450